MKTTDLDYSKLILSKVSFNPFLFEKEYNKAISKLSKKETKDLNEWLNAKGIPYQF